MERAPRVGVGAPSEPPGCGKWVGRETTRPLYGYSRVEQEGARPSQIAPPPELVTPSTAVVSRMALLRRGAKRAGPLRPFPLYSSCLVQRSFSSETKLSTARRATVALR